MENFSYSSVFPLLGDFGNDARPNVFEASQWNQKENMPIVERSMVAEEVAPVEEIAKEDGSTQTEEKPVSDMEIQVELESDAESELKDIKE